MGTVSIFLRGVVVGGLGFVILGNLYLLGHLAANAKRHDVTRRRRSFLMANIALCAIGIAISNLLGRGTGPYLCPLVPSLTNGCLAVIGLSVAALSFERLKCLKPANSLSLSALLLLVCGAGFLTFGLELMTVDYYAESGLCFYKGLWGLQLVEIFYEIVKFSAFYIYPTLQLLMEVFELRTKYLSLENQNYNESVLNSICFLQFNLLCITLCWSLLGTASFVVRMTMVTSWPLIPQGLGEFSHGFMYPILLALPLSLYLTSGDFRHRRLTCSGLEIFRPIRVLPDVIPQQLVV